MSLKYEPASELSSSGFSRFRFPLLSPVLKSRPLTFEWGSNVNRLTFEPRYSPQDTKASRDEDTIVTQHTSPPPPFHTADYEGI